MARRRHSRLILGALAFPLILGSVSRAQLQVRAHEPHPHPRLLLDSGRIARIQAMTHPVGEVSTWSERERIGRLLYRAITRRADSLLSYDSTNPWWLYQGAQCSGLQVLALAWILTQQDGHANHAAYASHTLGLLDDWKAAGYPTWPISGQLGNAQLLQGWALASDWLWSEMSGAQRAGNIEALQYLAGEVRGESNPWWLWGEGNDNNHLGHNGGSVGLSALFLEGHLSGAAEAIRREHYGKSVEQVGYYCDRSFGSDGGGYEGPMYGNFGMQGALPFALAMQRLGRGHLLDVKHSLDIQQGASWLFFCSVPWDNNQFLNFNDSDTHGGNLSQRLRGAGWLMGFANPGRPSALRHYVDTQFRYHDWEYYLELPTSTPFPLSMVSVTLLLSWPAETLPASAFLHPPTDFRLSTWFRETGMTVWRTGFHDLDANNTIELHEGGQGTVIGFFINQTPSWGTPRGHKQHDLNSFTIDSLGKTLFADSGYGGWGDDDWTTPAHNSILIDGRGTEHISWQNRHGNLVRHVYAQGNAPCITTGDAFRAWCTDIWNPVPYYADRALRHFLIMPRGIGEPPYVLFHDDVDVGPELGQKAAVSNQWHAGHTASDFTIDGVAQTAVSVNCPAAAKMTVLSPAGVALSSSWHDVTNSQNQDHWRLLIGRTPTW